MLIFFILEIIGTIAFAVSGAMVGIQKKMDVFGVCVLGLTTAVGGGILRDLILNITPPSAFENPAFAGTAVLASIVIFIPSVRRALAKTGKIYDSMILVMDSVGLGLFTVAGVQVAYSVSTEVNYFLIVFVGVLTGVGGGIMRDTFAGNTPYIFVKHFYASASLIGAIVCTFIWPYLGSLLSTIAGASVTMILRLLAAHFRWELPKA